MWPATPCPPLSRALPCGTQQGSGAGMGMGLRIRVGTEPCKTLVMASWRLIWLQGQNILKDWHIGLKETWNSHSWWQNCTSWVFYHWWLISSNLPSRRKYIFSGNPLYTEKRLLPFSLKQLKHIRRWASLQTK